MVRATRFSCEPGRAGDTFNFFRRPLGDFFLDLVHAPDAGADELFVLPAVVEDVPQDAPDQRHVGAGTEPHILVSMGRRAGKARVADDQRRVVLLFGFQHVQQRDGVRLGRVAANDEDRFGIVDVVVAVGHGAVAPCVRNARNRGRVTNPRLVIDVVRAPVGGELAEQIGLFVVVLGRAEPVD